MTLTEAQTIINNPQDPRHQRYRSGDPEITAAVEAAFKSSYGSHEIEVGQLKSK